MIDFLIWGEPSSKCCKSHDIARDASISNGHCNLSRKGWKNVPPRNRSCEPASVACASFQLAKTPWSERYCTKISKTEAPQCGNAGVCCRLCFA